LAKRSFLTPEAPSKEIFECAEARVHEEIPTSRLSSRWLAKRKYRAGITLSRRKREGGRSAVGLLLSATFQVVLNGLLVLLSAVLFQRVAYYKALMKMSRNAGVLSGLMGMSVDSYNKVV